MHDWRAAVHGCALQGNANGAANGVFQIFALLHFDLVLDTVGQQQDVTLVGALMAKLGALWLPTKNLCWTILHPTIRNVVRRFVCARRIGWVYSCVLWCGHTQASLVARGV